MTEFALGQSVSSSGKVLRTLYPVPSPRIEMGGKAGGRPVPKGKECY